MELLIQLLTFVEVLVCLLLILIVLMQRPRQEGLGASFGEGVTSQVWGAQTTNVLQKGTGWLATALFATTVTLAYCISQNNAGKAGDPLFKATPKAEEKAAPAAGAPAATAKPSDKPAEAPAPAKPADAPKADAAKAPAPKAAEAPKAAAPAAPKADAPKAPAPAAPKAAEAPKSTPAPMPAAPASAPAK